MGKATNFKFGRYIQRVHTNKSRLKIWEKLECGRIQGLPKFFEYPLLSQERIKLRTSNLACRYIHRVHPNKSPLKILGKAAWAYPGTAEIFLVSPIISRTIKATNFKFCTHILSIDRNKNPLQISGKVVVGVLRTSVDDPAMALAARNINWGVRYRDLVGTGFMAPIRLRCHEI